MRVPPPGLREQRCKTFVNFVIFAYFVKGTSLRFIK